jgi:hypothetical protein
MPLASNGVKRWAKTMLGQSLADNPADTDAGWLAVLLDHTEDHTVQANAAYAVEQIGEAQVKSKLRPLALGGAGHERSEPQRKMDDTA